MVFVRVGPCPDEATPRSCSKVSHVGSVFVRFGPRPDEAKPRFLRMIFISGAVHGGPRPDEATPRWGHAQV